MCIGKILYHQYIVLGTQTTRRVRFVLDWLFLQVILFVPCGLSLCMYIVQYTYKTMGPGFVNGVTQDKVGSHDYHTIGMLHNSLHAYIPTDYYTAYYSS